VLLTEKLLVFACGQVLDPPDLGLESLDTAMERKGERVVSIALTDP